MSQAPASRRIPPWHLWVVGALAVLWNGAALYDFVMSLTQGEAYYRASGMNSELVDYYVSMPGWVFAPWSLGIGGAVAGTILLLFRSRWAVLAFALSLLGALVSNAASLLLSDGAFLEDMMWLAPVLILAVCILLLWYASAMRRRGVLR